MLVIVRYKWYKKVLISLALLYICMFRHWLWIKLYFPCLFYCTRLMNKVNIIFNCNHFFFLLISLQQKLKWPPIVLHCQPTGQRAVRQQSMLNLRTRNTTFSAVSDLFSFHSFSLSKYTRLFFKTIINLTIKIRKRFNKTICNFLVFWCLSFNDLRLNTI